MRTLFLLTNKISSNPLKGSFRYSKTHLLLGKTSFNFLRRAGAAERCQPSSSANHQILNPLWFAALAPSLPSNNALPVARGRRGWRHRQDYLSQGMLWEWQLRDQVPCRTSRTSRTNVCGGSKHTLVNNSSISFFRKRHFCWSLHSNTSKGPSKMSTTAQLAHFRVNLTSEITVIINLTVF